MKRNNTLLALIMMATFLVMIVIAGNVFLVSVLKWHAISKTDISAYADSANVVVQKQTAKRGYIFDRNGYVIAQDNQTYNIVCYLSSSRPAAANQIAYVNDPMGTAIALAPILDMDEKEIFSYLTKDVYQTELGLKGRYLSKETKDAIEALHLNGIEFTESIKRSYPFGTFASHLIGYAQYDDEEKMVGKMGIESYFNSKLTGKDGYRSFQADKNGYILPGVKVTEKAAENGNNLYLTLDSAIQEAMEGAFIDTASNFDVSRIWAGVMEIDTGKILGWGQYPGFDPNTLEIDEYLNYGSQYAYEPGSVMKVFTYAAAIDSGNYDGTQQVSGDNFFWGTTKDNLPFRTSAGASNAQSTYISNANNKTYGMLDYDYGLIISLNTITAQLICDTITPQMHENYLKSFGFFNNINTEGIEDVSGVLNNTWAMDKLALTYGQGSSVTMLQLMQAFSAIFSDGTMVKPYIIDSIRDGYNTQNIIEEGKTEVLGHPIKPETAKAIQELMYRVVYDEKGTGKYYQLDEVKILAKTGTTQVVYNGSYESGQTIVSIMAALPADDPQVLVYYAFEGAYDRNAHANNSGAKTLIRKTAQILNLADVPESSNQQNESSNNEHKEIIEYKMPTLCNHSVEYAKKQFEEMDVEVIILGNGTQIISQYPQGGDTICTGQKVLLMSDATTLVMPNMIGFSRKECTAFWSLTGLGVVMDGYGVVTEQSIPKGTVISKEDEIQLKLE